MDRDSDEGNKRRNFDSHRKKHKHRDHRHEKHRSHNNETESRKTEKCDRTVPREEYDEKYSDTLSSRLHDSHTDSHYGHTDKQSCRYSSKICQQDIYSSNLSKKRDDSDEAHEYNFNFSAYKSSLNRIFFRDDDVIKK